MATPTDFIAHILKSCPDKEFGLSVEQSVTLIKSLLRHRHGGVHSKTQSSGADRAPLMRPGSPRRLQARSNASNTNMKRGTIMVQQTTQARFRPKKTRFAQVSNSALHDDNLSLKAKGLYSLIQSLITMPGADLYVWKIQKLCKEGEKAFQSAWKELKDCGYLKQYRMPTGENGRFKYEYDLLDEPDLTTAATINLNKHGEIISIAEEIDHIPQNGGSGENEPDHPPHYGCYAKSTPCLEHPVENGGGNSNTIHDNTVLDNTESVSLSNNDGTTDFLYAQLYKGFCYDI